MAGIDRLNVHERHAAVILVNKTDFQFTRYEFAQYAVVVVHIEVLPELLAQR
jgi:hypothetical protein